MSFRADAQGYVVELDEQVAVLLQKLLGETITILDAPVEGTFLPAIMIEERRDEPEDPTLRILLPSMSSDPDEAQSLRALTEDTMRTEKSSRLQSIDEALRDIVAGLSNTVVVPHEEVWLWLSGLNDLRLVLAERLGVETAQQYEVWFERVMALLDGEPEPNPGSEGGQNHNDSPAVIFSREELIALLLVLVSWWQDSLLVAVQAEGGQSTL